jgi:hypothetical protein
MAREIGSMGYPNKLSYDAFLYPNAVDTRKLLMVNTILPHYFTHI